MRSLILIAALAMGVASAGEVTLGTAPCGINKQCLSVPNDAGLELSIYASPSLPYVNLNIEGVPFSSKTGNGMTLDNVLLTDVDGNIVYLSGSFSSYRSCTRSGRGQTCSTHWSFLGGTLTVN